MKHLLIITAGVFALFVTSGQITAQDANYWTNQYGTEGELLGGAVVGSIIDLSAAYYNPGAMALTTDPKLVLSTDAIQATQITIEDGVGEGLELQSLKGRPAPRMFAIRLPLKRFKQHQIALTSLKRHHFDLDVDGRRIDAGDTAAEESFAGELVLRQRLAERWFGISWAHRLGKRAGIGISHFLAFRSQRQRLQTIAQSIDGSENGSVLIEFDGSRFYNFRLLWKIGLSFALQRFTCGFTVTTPSINLFGEGKTTFNSSWTGIDAADGLPASQLSSDSQENLSVRYRSPLSIAAGFSYSIGNSTFHLSSEWFDDVPPYQVMQPAPFIAQTTADTTRQDFTHELASIINIGLGFKQRINRKLSFVGSAITDFSAHTAGSLDKIARSNWDIYHVTLGSLLEIRKVEFTLGVSYGFGQRQNEQLVNFSDLDGSLASTNNTDKSRTRYQRLKLILGFSFPL